MLLRLGASRLWFEVVFMVFGPLTSETLGSLLVSLVDGPHKYVAFGCLVHLTWWLFFMFG